jgi:hypothetical protein
VFYFNTGALIIVGVYVYGSTRDGVLKRTIERFDGPKGSQDKRNLLRDFDGNFDFTMLVAIIVCAFGQFAVFSTIMETFRLSRLAGLNAGISQACWASLSFFNALVDLIFFGQGLRFSQFIGMLSIAACALLISLSSVFLPVSEEVVLIEVSQRDMIPMYKPVICAFTPPIAFAFMMSFQKWLTTVKKIRARDLSFAYYGLMSSVFFVSGIIYFARNKGSF